MAEISQEPARLDEYDEEEWFSMMHPLRPEVSRDEFHVLWVAFHAEKAARWLQ